MKLDMLDALSDDELRAVTARANELLKQHDEERKAKALADVRALEARMRSEKRALLESVGLSLKGVVIKGRVRHGKPSYHIGHNYQHPANKALTWNGKGQKPGWLRELEEKGGKAVEVAEAVPVGTTPAVRNAG